MDYVSNVIIANGAGPTLGISINGMKLTQNMAVNGPKLILNANKNLIASGARRTLSTKQSMIASGEKLILGISASGMRPTQNITVNGLKLILKGYARLDAAAAPAKPMQPSGQ
jgi:hypothetical protein